MRWIIIDHARMRKRLMAALERDCTGKYAHNILLWFKEADGRYQEAFLCEFHFTLINIQVPDSEDPRAFLAKKIRKHMSHWLRNPRFFRSQLLRKWLLNERGFPPDQWGVLLTYIVNDRFLKRVDATRSTCQDILNV